MKMDALPGRVMAVDWGQKRIGLAISDETRTLARGLDVISSQSRLENAKRILELAHQNNVRLIIVGVTFDNAGSLTPSGRRANRLAKVIEQNSEVDVITVDESQSTRLAKENEITMRTGRKDRRGHLDDKAAAVILQAFIDKERFDG